MTVGGPRPAFGVAAAFAGEQAVLVVRGNLDMSSAPMLGAYFDAVLANGYSSVVLDVAQLDIADLTGLAVIAYGASRLVASGGELLIRSPSATGTRTLDVTWLGELVRLELPDPASTRLGPEQSITAPGWPVKSGPTQPHHDSRDVMAPPAADDVVDGALRLVVHLARATVAGADGVSVSLRRHGRLATVAASDQTISDMDANQYATGEGPCVDASVNGHWFHVESLDQETRWPAFVPRAKKLGINAILSTPLMAHIQPVGGLNIWIERAEDVIASVHGSRPDRAPRIREVAGAVPPAGELDQARREAGLSHGELWLRYFELGGMGTALEIEAVLFDALQASAQDRDLIAQVINERHLEPDGSHRIAYSDDERQVP